MLSSPAKDDQGFVFTESQLQDKLEYNVLVNCTNDVLIIWFHTNGINI